ncbi:Mitochondrial carrier domain [Pseudocohnilembus persalinus]|uniref:ADP/ATP translocase n=1 Tax=Pseudocohnilembus persalinus TaxID=266149 RepID=A0A0V0Q7U8_PSEPJ|nr:Mitochondrial carrier domain [Pseudocohnilembus persalinus]|eukprot:KRW98328.1 Mitochondrial carrier domain [Pseudocohnilembus persalinus]
MSQVQQQKQKSWIDKQFVLNFFSGGLAGIISKTASAPIERVKLILQTESNNSKITNKYNGMTDCFIRTVKEEGVLSMWRGNGANVVRYFPTQALNFSFKDLISKKLNLEKSKQQDTKSTYVFKSILGGGLAGCMTTFFVYPLDFARTMLAVDMGKKQVKNLQNQQSNVVNNNINNVNERQFNGIFDCIQKVFKQDGIRGVYRGFNSCLLGIFIYRGLYFGIYDSGKSLLMNEEREKSFFLRWLFAQTVVVFSETISYPLDTVKRAMMMQQVNKNVYYKNSFDCFNQLYQKNGMGILMKGGFSNVVRGMGSSLCLVLYDELQKITKKMH